MNYSLKPFKITSLGIRTDEAYDLGVHNNENFFANNILVHNSNYVSMQSLVEKKFGVDYKEKGISNITITEWLLKFVLGNNNNGLIYTYLKDSFDELQNYMNCPRNEMHMSLEKICCNSLFKNNKKRYALAVMYSEGTWYKDKPKISVTGLESVSSRTPQFARDFLLETYEYILLNDKPIGLNKLINSQYEKFKEMELDEVAEVISINSGIEKINYLMDMENKNPFLTEQVFPKGYGANIKAAHIHNRYNKKHGYHLKPINVNGVKIKMLPLSKYNTVTTVNNNIGYVGSFPEEWEDVKSSIDIPYIWNHRYIRTVDSFTDVINYKYKLSDRVLDLGF